MAMGSEAADELGHGVPGGWFPTYGGRVEQRQASEQAGSESRDDVLLLERRVEQRLRQDVAEVAPGQGMQCGGPR